jgi:class 3 adenylate cyclase
MFKTFFQPRPLPPLDDFALKDYTVSFSLERLVPGVDNIRSDVLVSPVFTSATRKLVAQLVARHAGVEKRGGADSAPVSLIKEVSSYKQLYKEVMVDAVNKAKARHEPQIEYLAQAAVIKMLLEEIRLQYDHLVGSMKKTVRKTDLTVHNDWTEAPKLKDKLQLIMQDRETILQRVGLEICGYWVEVERKEIRVMREAIFGNRSTFFEDLLTTPLLHVQNPENEIFMLGEFDIALGRRVEDPDKYGNLLFFIRHLFHQVNQQSSPEHKPPLDKRLPASDMELTELSESDQKAYSQKIDGWLRCLGNMDVLLNWQRTHAEWQTAKKQKADPAEIARLKQLALKQKTVLDFFYTQFRQKGVIERIAASYEMQPEYLEYCPPLVPQQIMQYLVMPKARKAIKARLKRLTNVYGREFSLAPLNRKIKAMEQMSAAKSKAYLIRFLNGFARYHRDLSNIAIMREAMERSHLAVEEKTVTLSRENNTLYEFLLSHEQETSKKPIINHVVVKADVRGSTDITHRMNERGLNPASYFSLNFFDPISEILSEYDAAKVFIEGDAVILSIFEREDTPSDWYGVARACGIAINMLIIIQRYNEKSRHNQLPILELGIGISYLDKAPTFLFDGNNRIMISPAINHADRLSSCSKSARKVFARDRGPFNLYVVQNKSEEELSATADDLNVRYNVNGIELSPAGFEKLSKEIDLKVLPAEIRDLHGNKATLYVGKFPTKSNRYQRLIVRESQIPVVDPQTLKMLRISSRKYYEVCTHPKLYQLARETQS